MGVEQKFEIIYIPNHADGPNHKDCERGIVSSFNEKFVFVKFYKQLINLGRVDLI